MAAIDSIQKTEDFLNDVRSTSVSAKNNLSEFMQLRDELTSVKGIAMDDIRVQETKDGSGLERKIIKCEELRLLTLESWQDKINNDRKIERLAQTLPYKEQNVLYWFYQQGLTAEKCADKMQTTMRNFFRWKGRAISNLAKIIYPE